MLNPTGYKTPAGGLGGARGRPLFLGGVVAWRSCLVVQLYSMRARSAPLRLGLASTHLRARPAATALASEITVTFSEEIHQPLAVNEALSHGAGGPSTIHILMASGLRPLSYKLK